MDLQEIDVGFRFSLSVPARVLTVPVAWIVWPAAQFRGLCAFLFPRTPANNCIDLTWTGAFRFQAYKVGLHIAYDGRNRHLMAGVAPGSGVGNPMNVGTCDCQGDGREPLCDHAAQQNCPSGCKRPRNLEVGVGNSHGEFKTASPCFPIRNMTMRKRSRSSFPAACRPKSSTRSRRSSRGLHQTSRADPRARSDQGLRGHGRGCVLSRRKV